MQGTRRDIKVDPRALNAAVAKAARDAIIALNNIQGGPNEEMRDYLAPLAAVVANNDIIKGIPSKQTPFPEVGYFLASFRLTIEDQAGKDGKIFVQQAAIKDLPSIQSLLSVDRKIETLLKDMVEAFINSAGQYEVNRIESCAFQGAAEGLTEAQIRDIISKPAELRSYIARKRQELQATLNGIMRRLEDYSISNPVVQSEVELLFKHLEIGWILGDSNDMNYLPNDSAADYLFFVYELMYILKDNGAGTAEQLLIAVDQALTVMAVTFSSQSTSKAWAALCILPSEHMDGVDIGSSIRKFAGDSTRSTPAHEAGKNDKLQQATIRTPLRVSRLVALLTNQPSAFKILGFDQAKLGANIVKFFNQEKDVAEKVLAAATAGNRKRQGTATDFKKGAEGFFITFAALWNHILGRTNLFISLTGHCELSVPNLCARHVGIDDTGFPDSEMRPWAIGHPKLKATIKKWSEEGTAPRRLAEEKSVAGLIAGARKAVGDAIVDQLLAGHPDLSAAAKRV